MPPTFPRKCAKCHERRVVLTTERYDVAVDHDGRSYNLSIPDLTLLKCESCGNRVLPAEADDRVSDALRRAADLLTPGEIRQRRFSVGFSQKALAERLKIAESTLSRWETGAQIQQRSLDLLLRLYFDLYSAREYVEERLPPDSEGAVKPETTSASINSATAMMFTYISGKAGVPPLRPVEC